MSPQRTRQKPVGEADRATIEGKIIEYAWWMKKEGYKDSTIQYRTVVIRRLAKLDANLLNPESVKEVIASTDTWKQNTKFQVTATYSNFLEFLGQTWMKPRYKREGQRPFIPLEKEVDALVASVPKKLSCALQIAKECGCRIGEILRLNWTDLDKDRRRVSINPEKGSNPRVLPISSKLINMLEGLPKESEWIFAKRNDTDRHATQRNMSSHLCITKRRVAHKLACMHASPNSENQFPYVKALEGNNGISQD